MTRPLPSALLLLAAACASEAPIERFPNAWSGLALQAARDVPPGPTEPVAGAAPPDSEVSAAPLSEPTSPGASPRGVAPPARSSAQMSGRSPEAQCLCAVDRDRVHVEVPCGEAPCLDAVRVSCDGPAPGALHELGACDAESACSCSIDLPDDTAVDLACGLRACLDGVSYACSATGQTERGASCQ